MSQGPQDSARRWNVRESARFPEDREALHSNQEFVGLAIDGVKWVLERDPEVGHPTSAYGVRAIATEPIGDVPSFVVYYVHDQDTVSLVRARLFSP